MKFATPKRMTRIAVAAALTGIASMPALALDWTGYMRAGPQISSTKGGGAVCYSLTNPATYEAASYRAGNECDSYGEFGFNQTYKGDGGASWTGMFMPFVWNPGGLGVNNAPIWGVAQMYVTSTGLDIAPGATFWAGRRYWNRSFSYAQSHDTLYVDPTGTGGGIDGVNLGFAKLDVAAFNDSSNGAAGGSDGVRFHALLKAIPTGADGNLSFLLGASAAAAKTGGKSGMGFTVEHNQNNVLGGHNQLFLQYAEGGMSLAQGVYTSFTAQKGTRQYRIADSFDWQSGKLGGIFNVAVSQYKDDAGLKKDYFAVGVRGTYALTRNLKWMTAVDLTTLKNSSVGTETGRLTKLSMGPALALGPDFWSRPELRLYATTAKWNNAANALRANGVNNLGDGATSGTSVGLQFETWF